MIPDASACEPPVLGHRQDGGGEGLRVYVADLGSFPLGWKRQALELPPPLSGVRPPSPPFGARPKLGPAAAAQHKGLFWWLFVTETSPLPWSQWRSRPRVSYRLRLFRSSTSSLLDGPWEEHPASPVTRDARFAVTAGRPFTRNGHLYRWSLDQSVDGISSKLDGRRLLHLHRIDSLNPSDYWDTYQRFDVDGRSAADLDGRRQNWSWIPSNASHLDLQHGLEGDAWMGLAVLTARRVDVDEKGPVGEKPLLGTRSALPNVMTAQLAVMALAIALTWRMGWGTALLTGGFAKQVASALGSCLHHNFHHHHPAWKWAAAHSSLLCSSSPAVLPSGAELASLASLALASLLLPCALFLAAPHALRCSRWNVRVDVIGPPPATWSPQEDGVGRYNLSDLVVVTGATAGFFDRLTNMVVAGLEGSFLDEVLWSETFSLPPLRLDQCSSGSLGNE